MIRELETVVLIHDIANGVIIQRLQTINITSNRHTPIIVTPEELFASSEGE